MGGQIRHIFGCLTDNLSAWQELTQKYEVDLFVGLFMNDENESLALSAETLRMMAERGIQIDFDLYAPVKEGVQGDRQDAGATL